MMHMYSYIQYISDMTERAIHVVHSDMLHCKTTEKDLGPNGNTLYHFLNIARVNSGKTIAKSSGLDVYWEE